MILYLFKCVAYIIKYIYLILYLKSINLDDKGNTHLGNEYISAIMIYSIK